MRSQVNLNGNILLAAGCIAYTGPFTANFRQNLVLGTMPLVTHSHLDDVLCRSVSGLRLATSIQFQSTRRSLLKLFLDSLLKSGSGIFRSVCSVFMRLKAWCCTLFASHIHNCIRDRAFPQTLWALRMDWLWHLDVDGRWWSILKLRSLSLMLHLFFLSANFNNCALLFHVLAMMDPLNYHNTIKTILRLCFMFLALCFRWLLQSSQRLWMQANRWIRAKEKANKIQVDLAGKAQIDTLFNPSRRCALTLSNILCSSIVWSWWPT